MAQWAHCGTADADETVERLWYQIELMTDNLLFLSVS